MSEHKSEFVIKRPVPADEAAPGLTEKLNAGAPHPATHVARRALLATVAVLGLAGASDFGWSYWTVGRFQVATDDAYVKADSTTIAPKVTGYVTAVLVGDNEPVKAGQALARIDDRDFRVALDQAKAEVAATAAAIGAKQASLEAQKATVEAAAAAIDVDEANQTFAAQDNKRYAGVLRPGMSVYPSIDTKETAVQTAAANAHKS
jgi:membrane fusion protein, multidrug efflux system